MPESLKKIKKNLKIFDFDLKKIKDFEKFVQKSEYL